MAMLNFIETTTIATTTLINTIIHNAIVGECLLLFVLTLEWTVALHITHTENSWTVYNIFEINIIKLWRKLRQELFHFDAVALNATHQMFSSIKLDGWHLSPILPKLMIRLRAGAQKSLNIFYKNCECCPGHSLTVSQPSKSLSL